MTFKRFPSTFTSPIWRVVKYALLLIVISFAVGVLVGTGMTKLDLWTPIREGLYQFFIVEYPWVTVIGACFFVAATVVALKMGGGEHT